MNCDNTIKILGVPTGIGAQIIECEDGPRHLLATNFSKLLAEKTIKNEFHLLPFSKNIANFNKVDVIADICVDLAKVTYDYATCNQPFVILGGDHSIAIGTWSGVSLARKEQGPIGLIWIDAHLDAHTFETSESQAIHGMPVAALLGYGAPSLTHIAFPGQKIQPKYFSYIGVRSFEQGEASLVKKLNIENHTMAAVKKQSLRSVFEKALSTVTQGTIGFGVSLDLDGIDPLQAPGVGSPVSDGLDAIELMSCLKSIASHPRFLGLEIVEYNPLKDRDHQTRNLMLEIIYSVFSTECSPVQVACVDKM